MGKGSGGTDRPSMMGIGAGGPSSGATDDAWLGDARWMTDKEMYRKAVRHIYGQQQLVGRAPLAVWLSGSRAYGTNHEESDIDIRGVWAFTFQEVMGLDAPQPTIDIKEPDAVMHEIGKFVNLAAKSNPDVLDLLYSPMLAGSQTGEMLVANRHLFMSKQIVRTYGGYALNQLEFVRRGRGGTRGANHLKREKHFRHLIRLQRQCLEALQTGEINVRETDPARLREAARQPLEAMERQFHQTEAEIEAAAASSDLPLEPPRQEINRLLIELRERLYT